MHPLHTCACVDSNSSLQPDLPQASLSVACTAVVEGLFSSSDLRGNLTLQMVSDTVHKVGWRCPAPSPHAHLAADLICKSMGYWVLLQLLATAMRFAMTLMPHLGAPCCNSCRRLMQEAGCTVHPRAAAGCQSQHCPWHGSMVKHDIACLACRAAQSATACTWTQPRFCKPTSPFSLVAALRGCTCSAMCCGRMRPTIRPW